MKILSIKGIVDAELVEQNKALFAGTAKATPTLLLCAVAGGWSERSDWISVRPPAEVAGVLSFEASSTVVNFSFDRAQMVLREIGGCEAPKR